MSKIHSAFQPPLGVRTFHPTRRIIPNNADDAQGGGMRKCKRAGGARVRAGGGGGAKFKHRVDSAARDLLAWAGGAESTGSSFDDDDKPFVLHRKRGRECAPG